jgi:glutathione S-transferase
MTTHSCPTIYGPAFSPYVRAVRIYADELGLEHLCTMSPAGEKIDFKSAEHKALNPFGKVPVLLHQDFVLFETPAICRYLDQLAGKGSLQQQRTLQENAEAEQWTSAVCQYGGDALMKGFLLEFAFPKGENGKIRMNVVMENLPAAEQFLAIISQQLQQGPWLAGAYYSMADSVLTPFLDYAATLPDLDGKGPLVARDAVLAEYLQRLQARASARRLQER